MPDFVDQARLHAVAGRGGDGCASIHREKFVPLGGPDGGNGGRGGDVIVAVDASVRTLLDYHRRPHRRAGKGRSGQGSNRHGAAGRDLVLPVPSGTVVKTADGEPIADLVSHGDRYVVASGGKGGLGNAALASPRRKAPGFALKGEPGEELDVVLELKTVADVGLVGFPNAGKSSLIAALSAARPKIADYPFTTLVPNLGVVEAGEHQFVVADVPGLIPGASRGKGLGFAFLRHVERCSTLVHVVDCATAEPGRDPVSDFDAIEAELATYGALTDRPRLVVLNKVDVPDGRDLAEIVRPDFEARGLRVHETSGATREGLRALAFAMGEQIDASRTAAPEPEPYRPVVRPRPLGEPGFEVARVGDNRFVVRGDKPTRWVRQTDFANDEAVGYLADRLARLGVEEALRDAGAQEGAEVLIGGGDEAVVFDWDPSTRRARVADTARAAPIRELNGGKAVRSTIADAHRVVVKVGSSSLTTPKGVIDADRIDALVDVLAACRGEGRELVFVSSGAIAAGLGPLALSWRPRDLATQQAAASVGQGLLVARYTASFARYGLRVGQVLLTFDDMVRRSHYRNAQRTLERLLEMGVVPIVNENDTVATDEIRFGDNDRLAALVAHVIRADALVLLSDVEGLYDGDPRRSGARLVSEVRGEGDLAGIPLGRPGGRVGGRVGTGGMTTKVQAARIAAGAGIPAVLAGAAAAAAALRGESAGTYFRPTGARPASRLLWLAHATTPRGRLSLDTGAVEAVVRRRASLLPAGVVGVQGKFAVGDPVDVCDEGGQVVARGLINYDAAEVPGLMGRSTRELARELGREYEREIIHRDDLVVLAREHAVQDKREPTTPTP